MDQLRPEAGLPSNFSGNQKGDYSKNLSANSSDDNRMSDNDLLSLTVTHALLFIIIGGTVGNVLSMVTFCSRDLRRIPSTVLLLALTIVDTLSLNTEGTDAWLLATFGGYFCELVQLPCYPFSYLEVILRTLAAWTVVLITCERFVSVTWPLRAATLCTGKKLVTSWFVVLLVSGLVWIYPYFISFDKYTFQAYLIVFLFIVPMFLVVSGNAAIIYPMFVTHRTRMRTGDSPSSSSVSSNSEALTKMVIVVCVVFVLTMSPFYLFILVGAHLEMRLSPGLNILLHGCFLLYAINSAIKFLLYFFNGTQFRRTFMKLLSMCSKTLRNRTKD